MVILNYLLFLGLLSVIIFIHEQGHRIAMKRNGVKVLEFTIGFGPTLWQKTLKDGSIFKLKPILLGGYALPLQTGPGSIAEASAWAKTKIYLAGPFTNLFASAIVLAAVYCGGGPVGLKAQELSQWAPGFLKPFVAAFAVTGWQAFHMPIDTLKMIFGSFHTFTQNVSGPIGIVSALGGAAATAPNKTEWLIFVLKQFALLNVAIGSFNLIPIPGLDGGQIVTTWMARAGLVRLARILPLIGLALLLTIMLIASYGDIARHFTH